MKTKFIHFTYVILSARKTGFTLLEIMIALAIVGAVVVVSLNTINYHSDVAYEQTVNTRMLLFAKEKISEMELKPKKAKGVVDGTDFTYENVINKTEDEEIIEIQTTILGHGKKITLSELVLKKLNQTSQ
jgi:prepilin-type N-terminal cleavage/methylation domain-containing protein